VPDSIDLTTEVCERLLRDGDVGRVAICTPDGPHVVPVTYWVDAQAVVFRTSPYSLLGTYARNSLLAFEIDHVDEGPRGSWSVVARGRCRSIDHRDEVARLEASEPPRPWATGTRNLFLSIPWSEISGRRLGLRSTRPSVLGDPGELGLVPGVEPS
jgi:nitroimidazol reductase NimA-like FMN-containing flavoprotein (pyridoxamine 5'-phosphate oxidase superfamily)